MAANTRLASAVQILCVMARFEPGGITSERIASSLRTNPVVVRRLLKDMQAHGLVAVRPGKEGGAHLARDPATITLDQVHRAVEAEPGVFALRPEVNPNCAVGSCIGRLLTPVFTAADQAVEATLRRTTLAELVAATFTHDA